MIPQIKEINLPSYATLCKATVEYKDMDEKTITSQVSIDGQISPDFSFDWEVHHMGEKFIMPLRKPQASKENTSISSKIDLTFQHWAVYQLKRWYFFTLQSYEAGVAVADKYIASVSLNLKNFCDLYGQMLNHHFGDKIRIDLNPDWEYSEEPTYIDINYSYMWDVLIKLYELFAVRWEIVANGDPDHYVIKVGYPVKEMNHIFEYGFEGGLMKVERQVQDDNIRNMLLGRGGDKNIPYLYFKKADPNNPTFQADPDWVEELANVYFDRLRSAEFRSYIQGWKAQHISKYPDYTPVGESNAVVPWAYRKGYTDTKFDPVEYVKDDESIRKYGPLLGGLENNDEYYPSIQGVVVDPYGRIDQVVDVEQVTNDALTEQERNEIDTWNEDFPAATFDFDLKSGQKKRIKFTSPYWKFTIPQGYVANISNPAYVKSMFYWHSTILDVDKWQKLKRGEDLSSRLIIGDGGITAVAINSVGEEIGGDGIPSGTYQIAFYVDFENTDTQYANYPEQTLHRESHITLSNISVQYGVASEAQKSQATFDIWIKNIWQTTPNEGESADDYAERVWKPILGNHLGDEAAVCFSSGLLSTSEDYTFLIRGKAISNGIHYDTSKFLNGVQSHWRLTLVRSTADFDSLGKLVPNLERQGKAGDYFYFTGIELTHYYVRWAEKGLHDYKLDQLDKVKDIQPSWVVSLDKVRIGTPHYEETQSLLSQLRVGGSVRIADKRFIDASEQLYLHLQQITYKYNESQNTANITPNVEVVLGTDYQTTANPVATIQSQIDAIHNVLGGVSTSNIQQIVRMVGDRIYLRKDGITDRSQSITYFAQLLAALGFRQGMNGGYGWGIYQDENGRWVIETDRLNVRDGMQVNSLVINQIQARGGMIIESLANIEASNVEDTTQGYKVYFDTKYGNVGNIFEVDDVAYCHRYTSENEDLKYYKRRVVEIGNDYILLSKEDVDGYGVPSEGDVIVHYGNYTDKERQSVIIRDMLGGGYERMLIDLDSVTASGNEYYFAGYQSSTGERFFIGNKDNDNWLEYVRGKLSLCGMLSVQTKIGDTLINDYIKGFIPDVDYLQKALNNGETTILGGLVLTNLIQLGTGKVTDRNFLVYSGINGQPLTAKDDPDYIKKGLGIAAWYGGDMLDGEVAKWVNKDTNRYAQSLFRFDGSGYLAGGNIGWDNNGAGWLAGHNIEWSADGTLTLNSGIKIQGGSAGDGTDTLQSIVNLLNNFTANFIPMVKQSNGSYVETTWAKISGSNPLGAVKSIKGFYSEEFISAKGINDEESPSGVVYLKNLYDVLISNLSDGQSLVWDAANQRWVNKMVESGGIDVNALAEYLTTNQYAKKSDIPSLSGYATEQWVKTQNYLTSASLNGYATESWVKGLNYITTAALTGYATEQWVREQKYLTTHQSVYSLTMQSGKFAPGTFDPTKAGATLNVPTKTSHLDNDSDFATNVSVGKKLDKTVFDDLFEKVEYASGKWAIKAKYGLYSDSFISALGLEEGGGTGGGGGESYLRNLKDVSLSGLTGGQWLYYDGSKWINRGLDLSGYATESWVTNKGYITAAALSGFATESWVKGLGYLTKGVADGYYQPKGNYLTQHQSLENYVTLNTAQTITGVKTFQNNITPASFNSTNSLAVNINFSINGSQKCDLGWYGHFTYLCSSLNYTGAATDQYHRLGITDDGIPQFWTNRDSSKYTLLHAGNYSSFLGNYVDLTSEQTITATKWWWKDVTTLGSSELRFCIRMGSEADFNGIIGLVPSSRGIYGKQGVMIHAGTNNEIDFMSTGWTKLAGIDCATGNMQLVKGSMTATAFIKSGGTDTQALIADGSVRTVHSLSSVANLGWSGTAGQLVSINTLAHWNGCYSGTASNLQYCDRGRFGTMATATATDYLARSGGSMTNTNLVTNLNADLLDGYHASGFLRNYGQVIDNASIDDYYPNGFVTFDPAPTGKVPPRNSNNMSVLSIGSDLTRTKQLAFPYDEDAIYYRRIVGGPTYGEWKTIAFTDSNVASATYATSAGNADTVDGYHEADFFRSYRGNVPTEFIDITDYNPNAANYANYQPGTYLVRRSGSSELFVNLATNAGSTSALQFYTNYSDNSNLFFRKTIDSNRVSGQWRIILTDRNIGNFNAGSATQLQTARTIWGQSFNGTGNVSGNLTDVGSVTRTNASAVDTDVYGNLQFKGPSAIEWSVSNSSGAHLFSIVHSSGNVGIGTTAPAYKLHVAGVIYATTGIFSDGYVSAKGAPSSSDERLKTDFQPLSLSLRDIANAPSVTFRWRDGSGHDFGSIAQYWQRINPMFTHTGHKGFLSLQYGKIALSASVTNAREILELRQEIQRLQERIKVLEQK